MFAVVVFLFALTQFLPAVDDREFHRDEARWIHRAEYLQELLNPFGDYWDEETWQSGASMDEQNRLRAQPPLGSYVMGIGFLVQDGELPGTGFWNMDHDTDWNDAAGNKPTDDQLRTGRRTNAVVGALTVVAVFFIARRVTNDAGGVVAAVFLAAHPLMIYVATFAGSDAVLGLTIALAAVAAYRFADRPTWPRAIVLGIVIGLGGSAKLSPMGIAVVLAGMGGVALLTRRFAAESTIATGMPSYRTALQLILTPVVAAVTLVASYPYLWRDPVRNTLNLLDYRTLGMELQGSLWEGIGVDGPLHALGRIGRRLGSEMTLAGRMGLDVPAGTELAIAAAGLVVLTWLVARRGIWSGTGLIAAVLLAEAAIAVVGMRADWARYHLPILLLAATCIGVVAGQTAEGARAMIAHRSPRHTSGPAIPERSVRPSS